METSTKQVPAEVVALVKSTASKDHCSYVVVKVSTKKVWYTGSCGWDADDEARRHDATSFYYDGAVHHSYEGY
jgi:hypothetical protein